MVPALVVAPRTARSAAGKRSVRMALLHALLAAVASGTPDGGIDGLAEVEPDLRVVARRGASGFGVVARLTSSGFGEVNLITALRGPAAEDGLLRVGDLVLEVDGCADPYVPEPPYRLRVPASCVAYVPEAQGSWCATVRTSYTYQPRAYRTYRVPWHPRSTVTGYLRASRS